VRDAVGTPNGSRSGRRVGIDVGGTFVDLVTVASSGALSEHKVLATPNDLPLAIEAGLGLMAQEAGTDLRAFVASIDQIVHGTTIATNAVLTRSGSVAGLLTTEGLRDCLQMRKSKKEEPYNLRYQAPAPVIPRHRRYGVRERLDEKGGVIEALDIGDVQSALDKLRADKVEAIAICFMHSYVNPSHEQQALEIVRSSLPDVYVVGSAELWPQLGMYDRVSTAALSAYVGPTLDRYLGGLIDRLAGLGFRGTLLIMRSNGGIMSVDRARRTAAATLLSGPAGGPRAALAYVAGLGLDRCVTLDMGGTSSDTCLIRDGEALVVPYGDVDRLRIAMPMLNINTIGAGGGSIAWIDEAGLLKMGPRSAGAMPGPASYGLGGVEPTCTDADVVLGYVNNEFFLGGRMKLYPDRAREAIDNGVARPLGIDVVAAAAGMYDVVNVNMAAGVSEVSIAKGFDPREFALVIAGGAGPIHGAMVARELGIPLVVVPKASAVFCAIGMLFADLQHEYVQSCWRPGRRQVLTELRDLLSEMGGQAERDLLGEGVTLGGMERRYFLDMRYVGQFHEVAVPVELDEVTSEGFAGVEERFHALHDRLFGYAVPGQAVEIINLRLTAVGQTTKPRLIAAKLATHRSEHARVGSRRAYLPDVRDFASVPVFDGARLAFGNTVAGPALIDQPATTVFVPTGYEMMCDRFGSYAMFVNDRRDEFSERIMAQ
jgi:N-methylhydantoinase A